MLDQPAPQATSATRPPAVSRSCTSGIAGNHELPSSFRNITRLRSAMPSLVSGP